MGAGAQIGFHAAFNAQSGRETGVGNALIGAYLTKMGLPYEAVTYITAAPPNSMLWLTVADAKRYGIEVTLLDVSDSFFVAQALARVGTETTAGAVFPPNRPDASPANKAPELKPTERWLVIASRHALQDAISAQGYKRDFPKAFVLHSVNGQFAVAVGPIDVQQNPSFLTQQVELNKIPKDAYFSPGSRFVTVDWPN